MDLRAPRGTFDILPGEVEKWQYIEETVRSIFEAYGYSEIRVPIIEHTEVFSRGIGEGTDIVSKEMYTFSDRGGRDITLRPEGTASVMRSFLEHKIYGESQPTKFYYIGPMFRYERPQAGRYRQFHQGGVEVLGADDPRIDAELLLMSLHLAEKLGLTDLKVLINSVGCQGCRSLFIKRIKEFLKDSTGRLCSNCQKRLEINPLRIFDCKENKCQNIMSSAPVLSENLCRECSSHFDQIKNYLDLSGVDYQLDPNLVRGLDYYTKTAFEVICENLGAQDAVFGGGRYDRLAEEFGGPEIPASGFAFGMERLLLALDSEDELPCPDKSSDLYIATIGEEARIKGFEILDQIRTSGFSAEMDYMNRSLRGQMKDADRSNAVYTIILGDEELNEGVVSLRNMKTGKQEEISLLKIEEVLTDKLEGDIR